MDWNEIARLAQKAFRVGVNEWIGRARIQGGMVKGPAAVLTPGSLVSDTNLEMRMVQLLGARVPHTIAASLSKVLASAWNEWAAGFQIHVPNAYPSFAAVPGRFAPPTPAAVAPSLSQGHSHGEASLKAPVLAARLTAALRPHVTGVHGASPDAAMKNLATWVDGSFHEWKVGGRLVGLIGKGPVPTFAPPYVPVGPVIAGENFSAPTLFAGPRFGKIVV
jgi:hypothetical protein